MGPGTSSRPSSRYLCRVAVRLQPREIDFYAPGELKPPSSDVAADCRRSSIEISSAAFAALSIRRPLARSLNARVGAVGAPTHSPAASCANRSVARAVARAFRGINGRLPAVVSLWRAPSFYSTVPLRPRFIAALSVSHGDRRMRGRTQLNTAPNAEGSTALPVNEAAPSEIRAGALWTWKGNDVAMRSDIEKDRAGRQFLRTVAMCFKRGALPWPGVPP